MKHKNQQKRDKNKTLSNPKDAENFHIDLTPSSTPFRSNPENCLEMVNTYGTYEIQPTANSTNEFPAIQQGLPSEKIAKAPDSFYEGKIPDLK